MADRLKRFRLASIKLKLPVSRQISLIHFSSDVQNSWKALGISAALEVFRLTIANVSRTCKFNVVPGNP